MTTTAKFPNVTLADLLGEYPSMPAAELTLNADITSGALTVVTTTAIPSSWPAAGSITIDSEVLKYDSFTGSTFTINAAGRGTQTAYGAGAAAAHTAGAAIGYYVTAQAMNQILAEIVAIEAAGSSAQPNLVLNSDFGRRTVFGLAMPEVFADTSAWTSSSAIGVASNILTITTALKWAKWSGPNSMWRDGRWSGTFKATATAGIYRAAKYVDAADNDASGSAVWAQMNAGNFQLIKIIAGTPTTVATVAQALTINRWYWMEVECQGTTYIARLYDTTVTTPGTTKASSTLLQTLTGTISDYQVTSGGVAVYSDQASSQWGGIASGNGGVYVETWLPESWTMTFGGTLGGQAIGFDESADAGPLSKQFALRYYNPATSRSAQLSFDSTPQGSAIALQTYAISFYEKTSGTNVAGLAGLWVQTQDQNSANGSGYTTIQDAQEAAWTRKTTTITTVASARKFHAIFNLNGNGNATGTAFFSLPQLEQGSAATSWRNAPADDAPLTALKSANEGYANPSITSGTFVDLSPRDLAMNIFLPWDATVAMEFSGTGQDNTLNATVGLTFSVDGADTPSNGAQIAQAFAANGELTLMMRVTARLAAGKHRIAVRALVSAGTFFARATAANPSNLAVTASRGK